MVSIYAQRKFFISFAEKYSIFTAFNMLHINDIRSPDGWYALYNTNLKKSIIEAGGQSILNRYPSMANGSYSEKVESFIASDK